MAGAAVAGGALGAVDADAGVGFALSRGEVTAQPWGTLDADTGGGALAGVTVALAGLAEHGVTGVVAALSSRAGVFDIALFGLADIEAHAVGASLVGAAVGADTGVLDAAVVPADLSVGAAEHAAGGGPASAAVADQAGIAAQPGALIDAAAGRGVAALALATLHVVTEVAHAPAEGAEHPRRTGERLVVAAGEGTEAVVAVTLACGAEGVLVVPAVAVVVEGVTELGAERGEADAEILARGAAGPALGLLMGTAEASEGEGLVDPTVAVVIEAVTALLVRGDEAFALELALDTGEGAEGAGPDAAEAGLLVAEGAESQVVVEVIGQAVAVVVLAVAAHLGLGGDATLTEEGLVDALPEARIAGALARAAGGAAGVTILVTAHRAVEADSCPSGAAIGLEGAAGLAHLVVIRAVLGGGVAIVVDAVTELGRLGRRGAAGDAVDALEGAGVTGAAGIALLGERLIDLAVAVVIEAVTELFPGLDTGQLAAVERITVEVVVAGVAVGDHAAAVATLGVGEGGGADVGTGEGVAARGAGAAVIGVGVEVVVLALLAVAVVIGAIAAVGAIAVFTGGGLDHGTDHLAAVVGEAIDVMGSGQAGVDDAAALDAVGPGLGELALVATGVTVERVGIEVEAFVDIAVAVVVSSVAKLGSSG